MRNQPRGRNGGPTFVDAPKTAMARLFRASATHIHMHWRHGPRLWKRVLQPGTNRRFTRRSSQTSTVSRLCVDLTTGKRGQAADRGLMAFRTVLGGVEGEGEGYGPGNGKSLARTAAQYTSEIRAGAKPRDNVVGRLLKPIGK